jgi:hypothetical protein
MNILIEKLKDYSKQINLENQFDYTLNSSDAFFSGTEKEDLERIAVPYHQNTKLKLIVSEKYKNTIDQTNLDFWVINTWGGIRSFKKNERNIEKVKKFKKQITNKRLSKDTFSTISSLSKIASFIDPDNFVIYDSRVIYTLNWLLLTCENKNEFKVPYFPMPTGRNKKITDFDLNTIINLSHIDHYSNNNSTYVSEQLAYFKYCDFIKTISKLVYGEDAKPYELEMLLFVIADKEIFEDVKDKLKISIKD